MVDTVRTDTDILALLADNTAGAISAQDVRDAWVTQRAGATHVNQAWAASAVVAAITNGVLVEIAKATYDVNGLTLPLSTFTGISRIRGHGRRFTVLDGHYDALALNASGAGWFDLANGADVEVSDIGFTRMGRVFDFDALLNSGATPRRATLRLSRVRAENVGALVWANDATDNELIPDTTQLILHDVEVIDCKRGIFIGNVDFPALHDATLRTVYMLRPKRFGIALGSTNKNVQRYTRRITIDGLIVEDWQLESGTNCAALYLHAFDVNVSNVHVFGTTVDAVGTWAQSDKECIYTKAKNANFNNITVRASAGNQGVIAFKGSPDDAADPETTPTGGVGGGCTVSNVKIIWDDTRYVLSVNTTANTLSLADPPWPNATEVTFNATTGAPTGLTDGNTYYIVNATEYSVQLESSIGGGAIDITSAGTGRFFLRKTNAGTSVTNGIWIQSANAVIRDGYFEGFPAANQIVHVESATADAPTDQIVMSDLLARRFDVGNAVYRVKSFGHGFFFTRLRAEETWFDGGSAAFIEIRSDSGDISHVRIADCHSKDVDVGTHPWVLINVSDATHTISDVLISGGSMAGAGHTAGIQFDGPGTIENVIIENVDFTGLSDATKAVSMALLTTDTGTLTNVQIRNCRGIVTENAGTATLTSAATSITVNHGLTQLEGFTATPLGSEIQVAPIETLGSASFWWIDTLTATQFTIRVNTAPGADTDFAWRVRKEKWA